MSKPLLRIGTRGSALAMWQAQHVERQLRLQHPDLETRIVPISTVGDTDKTTPLSTLGGKGVFVRGLEEALTENIIDIAVHSLKDVTSQSMAGLGFFAFLTPESVQDTLVTKSDCFLDFAKKTIVEDVTGLRSFDPGKTREPQPKNAQSDYPKASSEKFHDQPHDVLAALPHGCLVGTGSLRRIALLRKLRPDIQPIPIRGNIETRMQKVCSGELSAILLSEAGLLRMGVLPGLTHHPLSPDSFVPAPGQGVIVVQGRETDMWLRQQAQSLSDPAQTLISQTQLALLQQLGFDCQDPFGIWSSPTTQGLSHRVFLEDSRREGRYYHFETSAPATSEELATWVTTQLRRQT